MTIASYDKKIKWIIVEKYSIIYYFIANIILIIFDGYDCHKT